MVSYGVRGLVQMLDFFPSGAGARGLAGSFPVQLSHTIIVIGGASVGGVSAVVSSTRKACCTISSD